METDKTSLLQFIRQAMPLEEDALRNIANQFQYREIKKGEYFLREGKISDEYLFLENGFLRAFLNDTQGNEVTTAFHSPNTIVFEVTSFFQRIPTQENIQALSDSIGYTITFEQLNHLFHTIPEFREFGRGMLVRGFSGLKIRTLSMINKTAEQRYETLLKSNPELFQNASLKHIASYLGITDTSLSRIRKEFSKK